MYIDRQTQTQTQTETEGETSVCYMLGYMGDNGDDHNLENKLFAACKTHWAKIGNRCSGDPTKKKLRRRRRRRTRKREKNETEYCFIRRHRLHRKTIFSIANTSHDTFGLDESRPSERGREISRQCHCRRHHHRGHCHQPISVNREEHNNGRTEQKQKKKKKTIVKSTDTPSSLCNRVTFIIHSVPLNHFSCHRSYRICTHNTL